MDISFYLPRVYNKPGGGAKIVLEYANYLKQNGNSITVYYHSPKLIRKFDAKSIKHNIHCILNQIIVKTVGCRKWFKLEKGIRERINSDYNRIKKSDIIVATAVQTASPIAALPEEKGRKAYFIQDYENWNFSDEFVNNTYSLGMTNITISNWLKEIIDSHSENESILIPNGINTNVFFDKQLERVKHSLVFHYRSAPHKGCEYAIQLIERLKNKYDDLFVNVITSENIIPKFPSYYNVHQQITPEEVAEINNRSQIFICTSIEEGFGLPGLEAMACGCALVSTSYRGVREYAQHGINALLSEPKNIDQMYENVIVLFENEKLMFSICQSGRETGEQRSLNKSAKKFLDVMNQIYKH